MPAWSGLQKVAPVRIAAVPRRRRWSRRCADRPRGAEPRCDRPAARQPIAAAFAAACRDEIDALEARQRPRLRRRPRHDGRAVPPQRRSRRRAADRAGARVGPRILGAVEATLRGGRHQHQSRHHPLVRAARRRRRATGAPICARALSRVLEALDVEDAAASRSAPSCWRRRAGSARSERHDVACAGDGVAARARWRRRPTATASRGNTSLGSRMYSTPGMRRLVGGRARRDAAMATLAVYLAFLAAFPDSHIVRKHGAALPRRCAGPPASSTRRCRPQDPARHLLADLLGLGPAPEGRAASIPAPAPT